MSGKISFKESSLPETLTEGAIVVVDGVTYVGNSSNEPVVIGGLLEYNIRFSQLGTSNPTITENINTLDLNTDFTRSSAGVYETTFANITGITFSKLDIQSTINKASGVANAVVNVEGGAPDNYKVTVDLFDYAGDPVDLDSGSPGYLSIKIVQYI